MSHSFVAAIALVMHYLLRLLRFIVAVNLQVALMYFFFLLRL
jgi:hypothetical protein